MEARKIYDGHADLWVRQEPILLSDYSARPRVLELCGDVQGMDILDLGCGEGYVGRQLARTRSRLRIGLRCVERHDRRGQKAWGLPKGLTTSPMPFRTCAKAEFGDPEHPVDLVIAVFLFNYMDQAAMGRILQRVRAVLKPGGRFIFTVPHPLLPWIKPAERPFYMRPEGGYLSSVDVPFPGRIWRRDGESVEVQAVHKTFTTYFQALNTRRFHKRCRIVEELHITAEHVALDPDFFRPSGGLCPCMWPFQFSHDKRTPPPPFDTASGRPPAGSPCAPARLAAQPRGGIGPVRVAGRRPRSALRCDTDLRGVVRGIRPCRPEGASLLDRRPTAVGVCGHLASIGLAQ